MRKKIFIFIPSFGRHGGIRVIVEWANRLARKHEVFLHPLNTACPHDWIRFTQGVHVVSDTSMCPSCDLMIITSPHSIDFANQFVSVKKVVFLQMMEHHFRPQDRAWHARCMRTYLSDLPIISISRWNIQEMHQMGRTGPTHLVGNGVNLEDFPISHGEKDGRSVLIEGLVASNPTKDTMKLGAKVAALLRKDGYRILAYSPHSIGEHVDIVDKFVRNPSLADLNSLYEEATILIKATKFDARSCSPMEAMTKGTVTARAIIQGDDDLVHGQNCLRSGYDAAALYRNAKLLLTDRALRDMLAANCRAYVSEEFTWDFWMEQIEKILWA